MNSNIIDLKFGVISITETNIKSRTPVIVTNINGPKWCYSTPTDKGGTLLYNDEHYNAKPLLNVGKIVYTSKQLESVFIKICNKNKKNIVGWIYQHPYMDLNEFNEEFFNLLMEKFGAEDKKLF